MKEIKIKYRMGWVDILDHISQSLDSNLAEIRNGIDIDLEEALYAL